MRVLGLSLALLSSGLLLTGFRPDDPDSTDMFRFSPGYLVETYDSPNFRVHFTREGPDRVRTTDANADGIPDDVEMVAATYEEALAFYSEFGFRQPMSDLGTPGGDGGDSRVDIYLVDFGGAADGHFSREWCEDSRCAGYIVQENDFARYGYPSFQVATRILASHELFHAVQAAYDADQGANWSEGSAVWASELFDPSLNDFEGFIDGWLDLPTHPLYSDPTGPVASYAYGSAIFPRYLSERFGNSIILKLWQDLEDGAHGVANPKWWDALEALLVRDYDTRFATIWPEFARWVLRSGFGGAIGETFEQAALYPQIARESTILPLGVEAMRLYPASLRVWSLEPSTTVSFGVTSKNASDLDALTLLAVKRVGQVLMIEEVDALKGELNLEGADEGMLALVNRGRSGSSARPSLCVSESADWVETCLKGFQGQPEEPNPPTDNSDTDTDSDTDTEPLSHPLSKDQGCQGGAGVLSLWSLVGLVLLRRLS